MDTQILNNIIIIYSNVLSVLNEKHFYLVKYFYINQTLFYVQIYNKMLKLSIPYKNGSSLGQEGTFFYLMSFAERGNDGSIKRFNAV